MSLARNLSEKAFDKLPPAARKQAADLVSRCSEELAYLRLAQKGFRPAAIIDVGAYEGGWTRITQNVFPGTPGLMVEAQQGKVPHLERVKADFPTVDFVTALLGGTAGREVTFYEMETGSSFFPEQSDVRRRETRLELRTLDEVVEQKLAPKAPTFLKIDVQGAELEVLAGAQRTLDICEVVQLEVAMLPFNQGAPTMLDVISYMEAREFVPFEVSGSSRPNGRDLVQIDLLFTRRESSLRPSYFHLG